MEARREPLAAKHPHQSGVQEDVPELAQIERARLLASEAGDLMREDGFSDNQILEWAETYISIEGSGDLESFLTWIAQHETAAGRGA